MSHRFEIQLGTITASLAQLSEIVAHRAQTGTAAIRDDVERLQQVVVHRADARVVMASVSADSVLHALVLHAQVSLDTSMRKLQNARRGLERDAEHWVAIEGNDLGNALGLVHSAIASIHRSAGAEVEAFARTIIGMGPGATLMRGFAIARDTGGAPVSSRQDALKHRELTIQFRDGQVAVENREYQRESIQ